MSGSAEPAPPPSPARPAASAVVLRDSPAGGLEVLLGRRTPGARFLPNAWVFPGGAVDDGTDDDDAFRATAVREVQEEVALDLPDPSSLVLFARLVTPEWAPIRFDTCFYLAAAPPDAEPVPDGSEIVEVAWVAPAEALARAEAGSMLLMPPTRVLLTELAPFATTAEAHDARRGRAVLPRILPVPPPRDRAMP